MKANPFALISTMSHKKLNIKKPDGSQMYLIDTDGKDIKDKPTVFTIRSTDSEEFRVLKKSMHEVVRKLKKDGADQVDIMMTIQEKTIASLVAEWENLPAGNGESVPFNSENLELFSKIDGMDYIRKQVNAESDDPANFMQS